IRVVTVTRILLTKSVTIIIVALLNHVHSTQRIGVSSQAETGVVITGIVTFTESPLRIAVVALLIPAVITRQISPEIAGSRPPPFLKGKSAAAKIRVVIRAR